MFKDSFEMRLFEKATQLIEVFEGMTTEERNRYIKEKSPNFDAVFAVWLESNREGFGWTVLKMRGELAKLPQDKILALPCHDREDADVARKLVDSAQSS